MVDAGEPRNALAAHMHGFLGSPAASGNGRQPRAQLITAAGEGSAAAIAINNDFVEEGLALALAVAAFGQSPRL